MTLDSHQGRGSPSWATEKRGAHSGACEQLLITKSYLRMGVKEVRDVGLSLLVAEGLTGELTGSQLDVTSGSLAPSATQIHWFSLVKNRVGWPWLGSSVG